MKKLAIFLTVGLISSYTFGGQEAESSTEMNSKIESLLKSYQAVGVSVAVIKDNKLIYSEGFGFRDLEQKLPVTQTTVFPIGSITKSFTGSLLGILESKEQINIKNKPSLYIPDFEFYNDKMNDLIIIEDLLSHKSGIGNQGTTETFFPEKDKLKVVQRLKYLKPEAAIKDSYEYSNMGYTVAGAIIEQITKQEWDQNIQQKIFEPLKMNSSYIGLDEMKDSGNFSLGYGMYKGQIKQVAYEEFYSYSPAGAIKSTVKDLSHWIKTWLNKGSLDGVQVIPESYVKKASSLQNIKVDNYEKGAFLMGEGFGWRLRSSNGHFRLRHGGNTSGFSSLIDMYPFEGIGIVVLTNQDSSWLPYMISDYISKKLLNLPPEDKYPIIVSDIYKPKIKDRDIDKDKIPTNPLKEYVGSYRADGFGMIDITLTNNSLFAIFPTYQFKLEHLENNKFFLKGTKNFKGTFSPEFSLNFVNSSSGKVRLLNLNSQKEPIAFIKDHKSSAVD
jgi:CubicO group peptidase (beta-lactamase class C family)